MAHCKGCKGLVIVEWVSLMQRYNFQHSRTLTSERTR
jgi:hypothetical protein